MQRQDSGKRRLSIVADTLSVGKQKQQLISLWDEKKVEPCYQNMVLSYLGHLEPERALIQIAKQKEKTNQNKTQFQKFKQLKNGRQQILANLAKDLQDQSNLQQACEGLDKLRIINLKICQLISTIKLTLQKRQLNTQSICQGFGKYLLKLNSQNKPITRSYLKNYIQFTNTYDPFLLNPYQKIQTLQNHQDLPEPISKLFKMNVSYVYRLIKAKNQMNDILKNYVQTTESGLKSSQAKKQEQQQKQQPEAISSNSTRVLRKRKLKILGKKYETIQYEQPQINKTSSIRMQSQPKKSMKTSLMFQQPEKSQKQRIKKFKIRDIQLEKKTPSRLKTQSYQLTEDEQINAFRKKVLERRRARKNKLMIDTRKQQQEETQEQKFRFKRYSLQFKKNQIVYNNTKKQQRKFPVEYEINEIQQNQSQQQLMQSRNLQNFIKVDKSKQFQTGRFRPHLHKRTQRIKLQPIKLIQSQVPLQNRKHEQNEQQKQFLHLNINSHQETSDAKRIKNIYYPLSPEIKQMNKQSSSGKSQREQLQWDQKKQDQENMDSSQDIKNENRNINFRIKRLDINNNNEMSKSQLRQPAIDPQIIRDNQNQKKFRDNHFRHIKQQNEIKNIPSLDNREQHNQNKIQKVSKLNINKFLQQKQQKQKQGSQRKETDQMPPTYRYRSQTQSNYPSSIAPHRIATTNKLLDQIEQMQQNKNAKKQVQLKPGQINIDDLFSFIQKQKINQFQRKQFQVGLWKENITLKHSYLTKFYLNSQLAAFGISSPRCDGDYSILYWGTTCAENFTLFLFNKYLDYLEKFTNLNNIYIGNSQYSQVDFQKKGSNYIRKRKNFQKRILPYIPFLSLQCSNIKFQQKKQNSIFYSQEIQQFSNVNALTNSTIGLCKTGQQQKFPKSAKFYQKSYTISEVNNILSDLQIDTYATSQQMQINQCKIFTFKDHCTIKSNYFYIRDGYFAPKGVEVHSKQKQKIMRLQMNKQDYFLFFGKKFQNIQVFVSNCTLKPGPDSFFAFKMFSKQLYGRLRNKDFLASGCYGNWDVNFLWQDQLKGTVIKEMPSSEYIYGPDNFYVALFKAQTLLFAFQVKPSDFFF